MRARPDHAALHERGANSGPDRHVGKRREQPAAPTVASAWAAALTSDSTRTIPTSVHSLRSPASPGTTTSVTTSPARSTSSGTQTPTGGGSARTRSERRRSRVFTSRLRMWAAPSAACVGKSSRKRTSPPGRATARTAVFVPPMSMPTAMRRPSGRLMNSSLVIAPPARECDRGSRPRPRRSRT